MLKVVGKDLMCSIISLDDGGCVYRFHKLRKGESWISTNLDSYTEESIIVIEP